MADIGFDETEEILAEMEEKVDKVYRTAVKESKEKLEDFMRKFDAEDLKKKAEVKAGKLTEEAYNKWRLGKMASGKRYQAMLDTLAADLTNADRIAMSIVGDYMPEVYAINRNFAAFEVEKGSMMDTSFTLYDRHTVERLIKSDKTMLPKPKVDIPKDKRWNKRHIREQITQGVLQGESIPKIAKRLEKVTDMDRSAAIRNARTATTGAQNLGRIDSYKRAKEMGIGLRQEWLATLDGRTRHTHRQLDGKKVEVGEKFPNGCRYPGDPQGPAEEVYNCRCTLVAALDDLYQSDAPRNSKLGDMSYEEWKNEHTQSQPVEIESLRQIAEQSTDKYDFWTNLDENQQSLLKASGMKLDDAFNQLHSGASSSEWKAPAPGGPESFAVNIDASASTLKFNPIPARSKGWMADATDLGVINIRKDGLGDSWEFIISHEAGHQISNMSCELQQIIITNPGNVLGRYNTRLMAFDGIYGEYNPEEAFATGVSNFVRHPESMKRTYPEAYQAFNTLFTTSPSALEYVIQAMQRYEREFLL